MNLFQPTLLKSNFTKWVQYLMEFLRYTGEYNLSKVRYLSNNFLNTSIIIEIVCKIFNNVSLKLLHAGRLLRFK